MLPWPAWAAGKISGPTEAAASVTRRSKPVFIVFIGMTMSIAAATEGVFNQKTPSSGGTTCLVSSHLGQTLKLLVQHARDHIDFLVVELLEQRRSFVVADIGLSIFVFVDENAQRNEEAHAVILFEQLLPYRGIAHQKECGFELQASHRKHIALIDLSHDHHAALADNSFQLLNGLLIGLCAFDCDPSFLCRSWPGKDSCDGQTEN